MNKQFEINLDKVERKEQEMKNQIQGRNDTQQGATNETKTQDLTECDKPNPVSQNNLPV